MFTWRAGLTIVFCGIVARATRGPWKGARSALQIHGADVATNGDTARKSACATKARSPALSWFAFRPHEGIQKAAGLGKTTAQPCATGLGRGPWKGTRSALRTSLIQSSSGRRGRFLPHRLGHERAAYQGSAIDRPKSDGLTKLAVSVESRGRNILSDRESVSTRL